MKTVRFASVISRAGKPDHYLAWSDPARDPTLRKAVKANRLMTIHQHPRGPKKDFGVVGLERNRDAQYFVFPRSLRSFVGARIVAIDYASAGERLALKAPVVHQQPGPKPRSKKIIPFPDKVEPEPKKPEPVVKKTPPSPPSRPDIAKTVVAALRDLRQHRPAAAAKRLSDLLVALRA